MHLVWFFSRSFESYDLTGLLSEYNSDSDDEKKYKNRPIPPWAKSGWFFIKSDYPTGV